MSYKANPLDTWPHFSDYMTPSHRALQELLSGGTEGVLLTYECRLSRSVAVYETYLSAISIAEADVRSNAGERRR
jgi:hypothetical protein